MHVLMPVCQYEPREGKINYLSLGIGALGVGSRFRLSSESIFQRNAELIEVLRLQIWYIYWVLNHQDSHSIKMNAIQIYSSATVPVTVRF